MPIKFTSHDTQITPVLRQLIEEKFARIQRHCSNNIMHAEVILKTENVTHTAEINAHISGAEFNAQANDKDLYKAIDIMMQKLNKQVLKHHEKSINHQI